MNQPHSTTDVFCPEPLADASAGTRLVYLALERADRPLTYGELADRTHCGRWSVKQSIYTLRDDLEVVESAPDPTDPRRQVHTLDEAPEAARVKFQR